DDLRALSRGAVQRRTPQLRQRRAVACRGVAGAAGLSHRAGPVSVRREAAGRARHTHYLRLHGADRRLRPAVHHRHPAGSDVHLLAAGLQMRVRADGPLTIVVALVAFGGAVALQAVRDARFIRGTDDVRTLLYVQSGEALKRLAL